MTNPLTQPKATAPANRPLYLPVKAFIEKMSQAEASNPYTSTFSFVPFIEKTI